MNSCLSQFPRLVVLDRANMWSTNAVLGCYFCLRPAIGTDRPDDFPGEFVPTMSFARIVGENISSLGNHVCVVIGNGAKKKVINSNAPWAVTSMTNTHSSRDLSKALLPDKPVQSNLFSDRPLARVSVLVSTMACAIPTTAFVNVPHNRSLFSGHPVPPIKENPAPVGNREDCHEACAVMRQTGCLIDGVSRLLSKNIHRASSRQLKEVER